MPPVGFEPKISAGERPKTYALDRAATGIDHLQIYLVVYVWMLLWQELFLRVTNENMKHINSILAKFPL